MTTRNEPDFPVLMRQADDYRDMLSRLVADALAAVDDDSPSAEHAKGTLHRCASTLDQVNDVALLNLRTLDEAMGGIVTEGVKLRLMAAGGGPMLDYADAAELLRPFTDMTALIRKRKMN